MTLEDIQSLPSTDPSTTQTCNPPMMEDLILGDPLEMKIVKKCLNQCKREYIAVNPEYGDCLFEAILCSIPTPTIDGVMYNAYYLRQQICMYMIQNYKRMLQFNPITMTLIGESTSLYHFIKKHSEPNFWGDSSILHVVQDMWGINISMINTWQGHDPITHYGNSSHIRQSHVVIIYNGHNHFTGTCKYTFFSFACLLACFFFFALDLRYE